MSSSTDICRAAALAALAAAAAGCHGSSSLSATNEQYAYGIWTGTDAATGLDLIGIVNTEGQNNPVGQAVFVRADGQQYTGQVTALENNIAGSLESYAQFGTKFPDGSTFGVGALGGLVTTEGSLSGTFSLTTLNNTTTSTTWSLVYDKIYANPSSLTAIAGTYTDASAGDPSYGTTITISSSGAISVGTPPASGCVLSGQVSINDPTYNIYTVSLSYASCESGTPEAVLNGIHFTGVAIIQAVSPNSVRVAVTGQTAALVNYGLVMTLDATS
jgi:hypothetical protein